MGSRTISRKHGDEIIRLTRRYYGSGGDKDIMTALHAALNDAQAAGTSFTTVNVLEDLAKASQTHGQTYDQIYVAFKAMGYTVIEDTKK